MSNRRNEIAALLLLIVGLVLVLSICTRDSADPSRNVLGGFGEWLGHLLVETFGLAVYALLAGWLVLVLLLFLQREVLKWSLRLLGWIVWLPVVALLADRLTDRFPTVAKAGAGGTLGAWLADWFSSHFYPIGRIIMVAAASILALLLTADFLVIGALRQGKVIMGRLLPLLTIVLTFRRRKGVRRKGKPMGKTKSQTGKNETPMTEDGEDVIPLDDYQCDDEAIPIRHPEMSIQEDADKKTAADLAIARPMPPATDEDRFADFELPPLSLLEDPEPFPYEEHDQLLREKAVLLEKTFADFNLNVRVVGINTGPVITQYEVALETGMRVNKVTNLADDLALNLRVPSVRIVAPIPGKNTVGIEIPNEHRATVRLKEVIRIFGSKINKYRIPLFLGKDTEGHPLVYDLAEMPHLLIAGRTGTGKSVCMNAIILSILMTRRPDDVKMIMIDPKMLELSEYGSIPHLMHPVVKDMKKAEAILAWAVDKMEERYDLLSRARVRNIAAYNELSREEIEARVQPTEEEREKLPTRMPYIVIYVDEMNDLMMTMRKEVEGHIIRLAQKSRAAGIHLVVATQKPTVDVITGLIKSNLPARICFQVASRTDSRVVLDEMGAEKLLGKGDMLFLAPGTSTLIRAQGTFASDREISNVVQHIACEPCYVDELVQLSAESDKKGEGNLVDRLRARDELYERAIEIVIREGRGSVSLLQRALGIGYGRAARLIDYMAEDGIVGEYNGSQAREVLYDIERWEALKSA
ncbi:MAG: hypothetical protein KatS3mg105_1102 [Gemmatales bacterium]|nr:MAG: hypothetical protein KatS3mg105_1102 [Gemmatales bacterium]